MSEFSFVCALANGLHARPASHLAEVAKRFVSDCSITNLRTGASADLKSVLAIIAADVRAGDSCLVRVEDSAALAALQLFVADELPQCDEPLIESERPAGKLPRGLEGPFLAGSPVSGGIGQGAAVVIGRIAIIGDLAASEGPIMEHERLARGFTGVRARIARMLAGHSVSVEAGILNAHLAMLDDVSLRRETARRIDAGRSAAEAVMEVSEQFAALLRERATDLREIATELLEEMYGPGFHAAAVTLCKPSIIVAETLGPHQLLALDRRWLQGIVVEAAGALSHAMILARSMGIPAVACATRTLADGDEVIVDGDRGLIFSRISESVRRFYEHERSAHARRRALVGRFSAAPAISLDGARIEIGANVSSAAEAVSAFENGADGIGLFRTELLFASRDAAPDEDDQFAVYADVVRAANGRPVILRTADVGGDKPLPYLNLPAERNPFLGYRGIRIYPEFREWIGAQIRAALRASALGPVWLMAPMIASVEEAVWFRNEVATAKEKLGLPDAGMLLGAMIEVPSAAFLLDRLCAELDFFSVGTNDLSQYFFAADRENSRVTGIADVRSAAFLALLRSIVTQVRARGKWIGLCGEMAGDSRNLPLLLGLGLNEISVSGNAIPELKGKVAGLSAKQCRELLARAVAGEQVGDADMPVQNSAPLLSADLVVLRSDSRDKFEAIRELANVLYAAGRVTDPDRIEEALWARESVYDTGLGFGFAIPHCKTDAVGANSIGILRLDRPLDWGAADGNPVRMVVLLAIRESGENGAHMKIFSRLARKLMDEGFRARLIEIDDAGEMVSQLGGELSIWGDQ